MPSEAEFNTLTELCEVLRPLKDLTEFMSGSQYVTCSVVYPAIYSFIYEIIPNISTAIDSVTKLKTSLIKTIEKRFKYVLVTNKDFFLMASYSQNQTPSSLIVTPTESSTVTVSNRLDNSSSTPIAPNQRQSRAKRNAFTFLNK